MEQVHLPVIRGRRFVVLIALLPLVCGSFVALVYWLIWPHAPVYFIVGAGGGRGFGCGLLISLGLSSIMRAPRSTRRTGFLLGSAMVLLGLGLSLATGWLLITSAFAPCLDCYGPSSGKLVPRSVVLTRVAEMSTASYTPSSTPLLEGTARPSLALSAVPQPMAPGLQAPSPRPSATAAR